MMFNYDFDKDATYLLACSFGPDSMALFDMLEKAGAHFVCCFINYHKRGQDSIDEENNLRNYCNKHNVPFEMLDARTIKEEGNFQEWAREVRYMFFTQMYVKYNAKGLFVAHHQDDMIETYIMQKQRNAVVKEYGMKEVSKVRRMTVIRPLLHYTKHELEYYDKENLVPYSVDKTNLTNQYERNRIRHEIIEKLSAVDRERYLRDIERDNNELDEFEEALDQKIEIQDELDIREIIALSKREFAEVIRRFANSTGIHVDISQGQIDEIRKLCLSPKPNLTFKLADELYILKEYDILIMANKVGEDDYLYVIPEPSSFSCKEFDLDFSMGAEDRNILPSSYPLIIRNAYDDDAYKVGSNIVSVNRLFIDWKMPMRLRKSWPIIQDRKGNIIYIPRYRKNFVDNHKSKFVIKL